MVQIVLILPLNWPLAHFGGTVTRKMLRVICQTVLLALFVAHDRPAMAQLVIEHSGELAVRGFHRGEAPTTGIRRSFQSDTEARGELDRILTAMGLPWIGDRLVLRASADTPNAEAGIAKGERFIFYNATFMQKLKAKTAEQWTLVSILAHELGHHLAWHTEMTGNDHKYELEADYFSGFVLRRLGATLDQSHAAMRAISPKVATPTHPALDDRLQVITVGWTDGGSAGAPRGLKERGPETTGGAAAPSVAPTPREAGAAARDWQDVKDTTSITVLERFVARHKSDPVYAALAQDKLDALKIQRQALLEQQKSDAVAGKKKADQEAGAAEARRRDPVAALAPGSGQSSVTARSVPRW